MLSDKVKEYLKNIATQHINNICEDDGDGTEYDELIEARNSLWDDMTLEERDIANDCVTGIFEEWVL